MVGVDWLEKQTDKIRKLHAKHKPQHGYLEPEFDISKPADENSDVPYKIIGATFIPTEDGDPRASCTIFMHPKKGWINRYYSGTDPVSSDNGYSLMSTSIWDNHYHTVPAIVNYRDSNHKYTFLQCVLLGLYYDVTNNAKGGPPELVEANIGLAYVNYKENKGFYKSFVYKTELPHALQGGGHMIGVDNKGVRNKFIIDKMYEMFASYGDNIYLQTPFNQLRTFVCNITASGNETWGTADPKKYHDDVLFSMVFAYICSLCYEHLKPTEITSEAKKFKTRYKLKRNSDGFLTRREVKTIRR